MSTEWVTRPLTNIELNEIRMRLEDGEITLGDKYVVIQKLVESGLLANKKLEWTSKQLFRQTDKLGRIVEVAKE